MLTTVGFGGMYQLSKPGWEKRSVRMQSIMGNWYYQSRIDGLRERGVDVYEFGTRPLQESSFGEDVLALQAFLSDEGYYNPVDGGNSGYFGSVTKEALQAWQRDVGVSETGILDDASRWAYIKLVEGKLEDVNAQETKVENFLRGNYHLPMSSREVFRSEVPIASQKLDVKASGVWNSAPGLIAFFVLGFVAQRSFGPLMQAIHRSGNSKVSNSAPTASSPEREDAVEWNESSQEEIHNVVQTTINTPKSSLRRLSEEEIQKYIAPMKGSNSNATSQPTVRRPSSSSTQRIKAQASPSYDLSDESMPTKHGTYYGGKEVRDRVKSYLEKESPAAAPLGGATQRMMAMGFQSRKSNGIIRKSNAMSNEPGKDMSQGSLMRYNRTISEKEEFRTPIVTARRNSWRSSSSFEDVEYDNDDKSPLQSSSIDLISGTDLEAVTRNFVVPYDVVGSQDGRATTVFNANGSQDTEEHMKSSRPVKVIKPSQTQDRASEQAKATHPLDPNATVVLSHKPIKLHKPARLVSAKADIPDASSPELN